MTDQPSRQPQQGIQAARGSPDTTAVQTALDKVARLETTVTSMKRELRTYGEPGVQGRDTQQLLVYFEQIHQFEMQIAVAMGIPWPSGPS